MRVIPSIMWMLEEPGEALDERLLPLLEAIARTRSLAAAVPACGISYRAGWGLLRDYERKLGVPLVALERGRGASLTFAGERLLEARQLAARRLARILPGLATEIGPRPEGKRDRVPPLRVAASHDLALAALAQTLPKACGLVLELSFMGSLPAIEAFAAGRVDMAGFHVPIAGAARVDLKAFATKLQRRRDRLIRFVDREQGLILPRGNPMHVRGFRDIAARGLRFVNRQRGSGTRLIVDQMIRDAGIDEARINGYRTEEFTHAAVAATVASGGAEVGFGLRAAGAEYQLGFVPLVRERYFLAVRAKQVESPAVARFVDFLCDPAFARLVRGLPGYQTAHAGTLVDVSGIGAVGARARRPGDGSIPS